MIEPIPSLKLNRSRREIVDYVVDQFADIGLPLANGSRFHLVKSLYDKTSKIMPGDPKYQLALEAERDMQTLAFVFDNTKELRALSEFTALLRLVHSDSSLPQDDIKQSAGRDNQFHLYVTAICQNAGLRPKLAEPDINVQFGGMELGIAAKRLKKTATLQRNIRDGASQIRKSKMPGVVAVDVSLALNPNNSRPDVVGQEDDFAAATQRSLFQFAKSQREDICRILAGTNVLGVTFHHSYVSDAARGQPAHLGFTLGMPVLLDGSNDEVVFRAFHEQYSTGLHNPQN